MRTDRPLLALLLAAAVLAGQWLAAAHEPDHALQAGSPDACAVCVYSHGAGFGALPSVPHLAVVAGAVPSDSLATPLPRAAAVRHHPIRGPPALLA